MSARVWSRLLVLAGLLFAANAAATEAASDSAKLQARLDADAAARVQAIVEDARAAGLPTAPLVARALEGASQQARGVAIANEVRALAGALGTARGAMGLGSRETEIVAGASAIQAGVPADSLTRLRASRPSESLTISLVVLCDLLARGVPQPAATGAVISALRAGGTDRDLLRMREHVHAQIQHGTAPLGATEKGLRELLSRHGPSRGEQIGGGRKTP